MAATYFLEWLEIIKYRIASKPRRPTVAVKYAGDFDEIPRISFSEAIGITRCFFLPSTYGSPTTFRSLSKYSLPRKAIAKVIATAIPSAVHIHIPTPPATQEAQGDACEKKDRDGRISYSDYGAISCNLKQETNSFCICLISNEYVAEAVTPWSA